MSACGNARRKNILLIANAAATMKNGKGVIAVKTDGTYQKRGDCRRGYSSKIGVVLLTGAYSGKFLNYKVMTKLTHVHPKIKSNEC